MNAVLKTIALATLFVSAFHHGDAQSDPSLMFSVPLPFSSPVESMKLNHSASIVIVECKNEIVAFTTDNCKKLWSRDLKSDPSHKGDLIVWLSDTEAIVPTDNDLEWIECSTGNTIAKAPFHGKGLSDVHYDSVLASFSEEPIRVRRLGNVLMVPFDHGYSIYDLINRKELYHFNEELDNVRREVWGNSVLIYGDMDEFVIVDIVTPRIVYKQLKKDHPIDWEVLQKHINHNGVVLLFLDRSIVSVDASTGKIIGSIDHEPLDCETYIPLVIKDVLHLLVQLEDELVLYNAATVKRVWSVKKEFDSFGMVMNAVLLGNGDVLVTHIDGDELISATRIEKSSGKTLWTQRMLESEHEFREGHELTANFQGEYVRAGTGGMVISEWKRAFRLNRKGMYTYYSQRGWDSITMQSKEEQFYQMSELMLHEGAKALGILRLIRDNSNELVFASVGFVRRAWDGKISSTDYDGEGLLTVDAATGKVKSFKPIPFCNGANEGSVNLYKRHRPLPTPYGVLVFGTDMWAFLRNDGVVDTLQFRVKKDAMYTVVDTGIDYLTIEYQDVDNQFLCAQIKLTDKGMKREILSVSTDNAYFSPPPDTTLSNVTLRYFKDNIEAYPLMSQLPRAWPKPMWTITEDQRKKLNIGDLEADDNYKRYTGIQSYGDYIYLIGKNSLGVASVKTGCLKATKWEGFDDDGLEDHQTYLLTYVSGGIIADMGRDVLLAKVQGACDIVTAWYSGDVRSNLEITFSRNPATLILADTDKKKLEAWRLR